MKRLMNLSPATVTAAIAVVAVVGVLAVHGQQMFSPGPLNAETRSGVTRGGVRSHAEIGGNCAACHAPPWSGETMASRCMDCHHEVRAQMDNHGPMHGLLAAGKDCRDCHGEHRGPHAALTDMTTFDHGCTAFRLTGKHKGIDCKACHSDNLYKGTPQNCVSCHAEPKVHKGRYGTACEKCHGTGDWKASTLTMAEFDHDLTAYRLTGKHKSVDCKGCHVRVPDRKGMFVAEWAPQEIFKGTPKNCATCHAEPKQHKMSYGTDCKFCHTTADWQEVTFRHRFPVNHGQRGGKGTSCATCHAKADNFVTHTCYGCHAHTPEKEKLRRSHLNVANLDNCTSCHPAGRGNVRRGSVALADCPGIDVAQDCPERQLTPYKVRPALELSDLLTASKPVAVQEPQRVPLMPGGRAERTLPDATLFPVLLRGTPDWGQGLPPLGKTATRSNTSVCEVCRR
jgi:hypothetical protein